MLTPCAAPGCRRLVERVDRKKSESARYCDPCKERKTPASLREPRDTLARKVRSSAKWKRVRARRLAHDGNRCTALENGERCTRTHGLEVHHLDPIEAYPDADPYDFERLRTLCGIHHRLLEREARERALADQEEE